MENESSPAATTHRLRRRLLAVAASLLLLWTLLGFFVLPALLVRKLPVLLSEALHRPVKLARVRANPFTLSVTLDGLTIGERSGALPLLSVGRLHANAEAISLFRRAPVLRELVVQRPALHLVRESAERWNVSDLVEELRKETPGKEPARFSVANIRVEGGSLDLEDRPNGARHTVRDLRVGLPFLSNLPDRVDVFTEPLLAARINGSPFELKGRTKPFADSLSTVLDVKLTGIDLPAYLSYLPREGPASLSKGKLDLDLSLSFSQAKGRDPETSLSGSVGLADLALTRPPDGAPLVYVERLRILLGGVDPFRRRARVTKLELVAPRLTFPREADAAPRAAEKASTSAGSPSPTWSVRLESMEISRGSLELRDAAVSPAVVHSFSEVAAKLVGFDTDPKVAATLVCSAKGGDGSDLSWDGRISLAPSVEGTLHVTGLQLPRLVPYGRTLFRGELASASLDLTSGVRWTRAGGAALTGLEAKVTSPAVRLPGPGPVVLEARSVSFSGGSVEVSSGVVGELSADGLTVALKRLPSGAFDLAGLVPVAPATATAGPEAGSGARESSSADKVASASAPWQVDLRKVSLAGGSFRFVDESVPGPFRFALSQLSLQVEGLSTRRGAPPARLSAKARLEKGGSLSLRGSVAAEPLATDLEVDLRGLQVPPLLAYLPDRVKARATSGALLAKGRLSVTPGASGLTVRWRGELEANGFTFLESEGGDELARFASLRFKGSDFSWNPFSASVTTIALREFGVRVGLDEAGAFNVRTAFGLSEPPPEEGAEGTEGRQIAAPAEEKVAAPEESGPSGPVKVGEVVVEGGTVQVTDLFVKPSFELTVHELKGRVAGLSSDPASRAEVALSGSAGAHAPVSLTGSVNPLAATRMADLTAAVENVDLVPFTPYTLRFAGYPIRTGSLEMKVHYVLDNGKLTAENSFVVDRFALGEKTEVKGARSLPLKLAVALLKDRNGVIRIDLPVSGSLDDPKFRIGRIVLKMLGNLVVKAVTSPFALLGSAFGGGGAELSRVDFPPGEAALTPEARKVTGSLAKALEERPALALEVTGTIDPEKDASAAARAELERKLEARWREREGTPPER